VYGWLRTRTTNPNKNETVLVTLKERLQRVSTGFRCHSARAHAAIRSCEFALTAKLAPNRASWRTDRVFLQPALLIHFFPRNMAELRASKVERQADAPASPSWGAELDRLLRALGNDEELLDEASHALQAATTGAAFDAAPAVTALVLHCDTPSRLGEVASRVFYLQQDVEQRAAHEFATQRAEEIDELCARTEVIDVTAESSSDDEAPRAAPTLAPAPAQDDGDGFAFLEPPAADDSETLARRLAAEDRTAERERKRSEEGDAELARRLAAGADASAIDIEQIDRDEKLARRLSAEAATATPGALEPVAPRVTPTHLGTRRLRVGLPGGQAVTFDLDETQPLSMVFEPLRIKLGLDAREDPYSAFVLAQGEERYSRAELHTAVGAACGAHRRLRFRVERRDFVGHIVMGRGAFATAPTIFRITAPGRTSPLLVIRDPFGDSGLIIAQEVERFAVTNAHQQRRADLKGAALKGERKRTKPSGSG